MADQKPLNEFPNVSMVAIAFTGFNSINIKACRNKDIAVYNVPAC